MSITTTTTTTTTISKLESTAPNAILLAGVSGKDHTSRLNQYRLWLDENGKLWHDPDSLAAYRDHLTMRLSPASANAHLSTIRKQIERILETPEARDSLETMAYTLPEVKTPLSPLQRL